MFAPVEAVTIPRILSSADRLRIFDRAARSLNEPARCWCSLFTSNVELLASLAAAKWAKGVRTACSAIFGAMFSDIVATLRASAERPVITRSRWSS